MFYQILCVVALFLQTSVHAQQSGIIAGTSKSGYSGDGLAATVARLKVPSDVFASPDGTIHIADTGNNRIRRISPTGIMETIAGNGQRTFSTDENPATDSGLMSPSSIAVDGVGNVYFTEWTGHRVRVIMPTGEIKTIAGNGESGYAGENLPATETSLATPSRIFLDGKGNLYITEWDANRVRRIGRDGIISTVIGDGNQGFSGDGGPATLASLNRPNGLFVTPEGEIYVSDLRNNRVRRVNKQGIIETVAGNGDPKYTGDDGPATEASLNAPAGIFVDSAGNLYITDGRNTKVRRVDIHGTITTQLHGLIRQGANGKPTRKPLRSPNAVFVDRNGHIYISDGTMNAILRVPNDASPTTLPVSEPGVVGYAVNTGLWQQLLDLF